MADKRTRKKEFADLEAVDDMLDNINNFIEGIYRDLNIRSFSIPELNSVPQILNSSSRSTSLSPPRSSPVRALNRAIVTSNSPNVCRRHRTLESSSHPEFAVETVRVNRLYGTPDHNLRSVGISIGNSSTISSGRKPSASHANAVEQIIDFTRLQTPESSRYRLAEGEGHDDHRRNNYEDGDIVIVSSRSNEVIDLSTPTSSAQLSSRKPSACHANAGEQVIDLTQSQPPESLRYRLAEGEWHGDRRRNNYEDGDIIIVSSRSNEVIDLSTPTNSTQQVSSRVLCLNPTPLEHNISGAPIRPITSNNQHRRRFSNRPSRSQQSIVIRNTSKPKKAIDKSSSNEYSLLSTVVSTSPGARTPFMCPICMESTVQRQPTSTRCGHIFCQSCIRQAIEFSRKCPLCKAQVLPNHLLRIYL
uniref:RING-type domain-containing protein n=1 Tax=Glossina austeni TaxID=7395 RepID=A0A1A9VG16_GLOAU